MKTLVIGGAGYIGSHMVRCLAEAGAEVAVFDDFSTGHPQALGPGVEVIEGDLLDAAALDHALTASCADVVMHFAALSVISDSSSDPLRYYRHNVGGTLQLLEAMRRHDVRRLVFSSTAALFGAPTQLPITEDAPTAPVNPYGWSKQMAERVIADACAAHGLRAVALRYFNAAGAHCSGEIGESHQPETHLIPNVLRAAAGLGPGLTIFGDRHATHDGSCVRDYVHVDDLCRAHQQAAQALERPELPAFQTYNLGSGRGYSVHDIVRAAERVVGQPIQCQLAPPRAGDPPCLVADSARARQLLNWTPRHTEIESIIASAWRWHRAQRY